MLPVRSNFVPAAYTISTPYSDKDRTKWAISSEDGGSVMTGNGFMSGAGALLSQNHFSNPDGVIHINSFTRSDCNSNL